MKIFTDVFKKVGRWLYWMLVILPTKPNPYYQEEGKASPGWKEKEGE